MQISWTPQAIQDFEIILKYLHSEWGLIEVEKFIGITNSVLKLISEFPRMFVGTSKRRNVHKGFITKQICVFYLIKPRKKEIVLLTFWDNRRNPAESKY